jgi:hypothetical protein
VRRCGKLKLFYTGYQSIQSLRGCAKLESAVRYFRTEVQYAPEMAEATAVYYVVLEKTVFNGCYS